MADNNEIRQRIDVLDGWRGFSITLVLVGHFFPNSSVDLGIWGVEWFFVLSGRLMADILFVRRAPLKQFYRRRLSRVVPVVLVFVPTMFLAFYYTQWHFKPSAAFAALTFTLNYASVFKGHQVPLIAHIWSLCIEEHTYLLLGTLAFMARRYRWPIMHTLYLLAAASVADLVISSSFTHANYFDVIWRTDAHLYAIVFGGIAYLALRQRSLQISASVPVIAILIAALLQLMNVGVNQQAINVLSTLSLAIAVATLQRAPPLLARIAGSWLLRRAGILSFSIYIWQQPFYWIAQELHVNFAGRVALLGAALMVGIASFYFLEQPARRWLNQLQRGKTALPQSVRLPS